MFRLVRILVLAALFLPLNLSAKSKPLKASGNPGAVKVPSHVVFGYSASWMDTYYPPTSYNWAALSHVARSFMQPHADGSITVTPNFWDSSFEKLAKKHGVKLIASLGGAGVGEATWLSLARNPKALKIFFEKLEKLITAHDWDGVDIDWEPGPLNKKDSQTYTAFLLQMRKRNPNWIIASAMGVSDYWAKHREWKKYFPALDFVNAMTYDMAGDWVGYSSHDNNLYPPAFKADGQQLTSISTQVENLVQKYKVPKEKILVGLRFDGFAFGTKKMGDKFGKRKKGEAYNYVLAENLRRSGLYEDKWDDTAKVPYLERKKGVAQTITYNNPRGISGICEYTKDKGFGGVIIWALGGDVVDGKAPLLDAVAKSFGVQGKALRREDYPSVIAHRLGSLRNMHKEITRGVAEVKEAGQIKKSASLKPEPLPVWIKKPKSSLKYLKKAERYMGELAALQALVNDAVINLPALAKAGKKLNQGKMLLVDDFEDGDLKNKLGGLWEVDVDEKGLGSTVNPQPFKLSQGAGPKGDGNYAKIWGHFGKNVDPWPHANLTMRILEKSAPADMSGFKKIQFWVKGDGKTYEVLLQRALVRDFCHFRISFVAPKKWTKISLDLSKAEQPKWGKQLPWEPVDLRNLVFSIVMGDANDEDYELAIDDLSFVP